MSGREGYFCIVVYKDQMFIEIQLYVAKKIKLKYVRVETRIKFLEELVYENLNIKIF